MNPLAASTRPKTAGAIAFETDLNTELAVTKLLRRSSVASEATESLRMGVKSESAKL